MRRLLAFLPMLFLVATLAAQVNCQINDLTVTLAPNPAAPCQYFVVLNFNHSGTTNQFTVHGNGQNYGTFPYGNLPLSLGPFTAGAQPQNLEFVVADAVLQDCEDVAFVVLPACDAGGDCDINDVLVQTGPCTPNAAGFALWIDFNVQNPGNDFFELWTSGNQYLGIFPLSALPLQLTSVPWNGDSIQELRICINDHPDCCAVVEFPAPSCVGTPGCTISDLNAIVGDCTSDSTFSVTLNFDVFDATQVDSFHVSANGQSLGVFGLNQLPLTLDSIDWNGLLFTHMTVCAGDLPGCCREFQVVAPSCLPFEPCEVVDIFVNTGACTSDSTYKLRVNFQATSPGLDSFALYANGALLGNYPNSAVPLTIDSFPWSGNNYDVIKICVQQDTTMAPCCRTEEFLAPDCLNGGGPCEVFDLAVDPGDCTSNTTYSLWVSFQVQNPPSQTFILYANGQVFGTYNLSQLPLTIPNFPYDGGPNDVVKVCFSNNVGSTGCCRTLEFPVPDCLNQGGDCEIFDLQVETGDCHVNDSNYVLIVNFQVQNPPSQIFVLYANGVAFGTYNLNQLPLTIPNFPWNGGPNDVVKVCMADQGTVSGCCRILEFPVPDCFNQGGDCEVFDLVVDPGACTSNTTYNLWVNFQVQNPPSQTFVLWANGQVFGTYNLNQLPLNIPNFPYDGGPNDVIKVCFNNNTGNDGCCRTLEFAVPDCLNQGGDCEIFNLEVDPGNCTSDSTYWLFVNFQVQNPTSQIFVLYANGVAFGTYNLSQLPLNIPNFPWDGGQNDYIKVCMADQGSISGCCRILEFLVPDCFNQGGDCEVYDLVVDPGACTSNTTYNLWVNFQVQNPPSQTFVLWANGQVFGTYNLSQLPLNIPNFPYDGGPNDVIKVCFNNSAGNDGCCRTLEFAVPDCLNQGGDCEIFDLEVETGDCHVNDSNYVLIVNFQVQNPPSQIFVLYANGVVFGTYNLNQLPLTIPNFPWNGGQNDVVKVCMADQGAVSGCCRILEFPVPDCFNQGGDCEIFDLVVDTGDCTSDSTYSIWINFQVQNPTSGQFALWANGVFFGTYNLNQLPLNIPNFPWNGGVNDYLKVCIVAPNTPSACCRTIEYPVPGCLGGTGDDCHIYDLQVIRTPCLCGQFFAVITFEHDNGGPAGFDIVGNGNNYGNYGYNHPQPIIIGPLDGDGVTEYEFVVVDHENDDCFDAVELGKVECTTPTDEVVGQGGQMVLSPNPASNQLNVNATLPGLGNLGEATVEVYHADGRRVRSFNVPEGGNFRMDVFDLPAGIYRLSVQTAAGRVEGSFAKQ